MYQACYKSELELEVNILFGALLFPGCYAPSWEDIAAMQYYLNSS